MQACALCFPVQATTPCESRSLIFVPTQLSATTQKEDRWKIKLPIWVSAQPEPTVIIDRKTSGTQAQSAVTKKRITAKEGLGDSP